MIEEEKALDLVMQLDAISANLYYPSESDEPFKGFYWLLDKAEGPLQADEVRQTLGLDADTNIEERKFDTFFYPVSVPQDWHTEEDLDIIDKFQEMIYELRKLIRKPQVFVVGEVEKDVYIVGKAKEGNFWAGLQTKVVET